MQIPNPKSQIPNPLRVCFISRRFFPTVSGMSVYAANLLRELVRGGVDVTLVAQYRTDETGVKVYGGGAPPDVAGVKVIGLELVGEQNGGDFETDIRRIVETVKREHDAKPFDLLHAQYGYPTGYAALEASKLLNVPNVVSIQGGDGHWVGVGCCATHRNAMRIVLENANEILIGSRSFAAEVEANHQTDASRFTIVPGAVDTNRFIARSDWEAGKFIDEKQPIFLYHGRVDRRKGALDLVEAFAELLKEIEMRPQLIYSGIGPDYEAVKTRVEELDLTRGVQMLGYADYENVPEIYRRADVFVSPTYAEGFSNTILEAMASGLAIVSTRAVGVVDCLRHGENGLLVAPGNIAELKNALRGILIDDELRRTLARNALDECRAVYSWGKIGRQIVGIYERVKIQKPKNDWRFTTEIDDCRYRRAPHLL
jgi:glycosyltransferase involved in cell wall biosynthesis